MTEATRLEKPDHETARDEMRALLDSLGVTIACEFVPLSRSRNAKEKHATVNWRVTVQAPSGSYPKLHAKAVRNVLTCDYSQGVAHLKGYDEKRARLPLGAVVVKAVCESGKADFGPLCAVAPTREDVLGSLASDSDAIDHASYESWAGDLGYDADSRKGEAIYRACLEIALKLRAAFGDEKLCELRELAGRF